MSDKYFVPRELKIRPNWVLWKLEMKDGRLTKIPYQKDGIYRASSTNSRTWCTYSEATEGLCECPHMNGLGFVLDKSSRIVFADIDHCIDENGTLSDIAKDILSAFEGKTFVEVSQSGSGLHILALGEIPRSFKNSKLGVEMYSDGRYIAFTGNALFRCDLVECPTALNYVFDKYKTEKRKTKSIEELRASSTPVSTLNGDAEIIARASHRGRFEELYKGDYRKAGYVSHSEADLALCILIAYWCDRNPDSIDRLFRSSVLYREKWEREDYRNSTIVKACSLVTETFTEWKERIRYERIEALREDWD